jgi:hypothetical protein
MSKCTIFMENWIPVSLTGMTKKGYLDDIIGARSIGMTREGGAYFSRQRSLEISIPYFKSKFLT